MAPSSSLTTENILAAIKRKLERICPLQGWPEFGRIDLTVVIHDRCVVKTEGGTVDITKEESGES